MTPPENRSAAGLGVVGSYQGRPLTPRRYGGVGAGVAVAGAVVVLVSFAVLDWIGRGGSPIATFRQIHDSVGIAGYAAVYFGWLGWVLLAVTLLLALAANGASPIHGLLRTVGVLVGLGAVAATVFALKQLADASWSDIGHHADVGYWLAIAGFALMAGGAVIGPRKVNPPPRPWEPAGS